MTPRIKVRIARRDDEEALVRFLQEHWRENHVFVTDPELMLWQHTDPNDSSALTFVLAVLKENESPEDIIGVLGFIPFRRFDPASHHSELSLAIWRVRDDAGSPELGLLLLKTIERIYHPSMVIVVGISESIRSIYSVLGYTLGRLSQAALFGHRVPEHPVAFGVEDWMRQPRADTNGARLLPVGPHELQKWRRRIDELGDVVAPRKSTTYLQNRFSRHPYYEYDLRGVEIKGTLQAIFVLRRVEVPDCGAAAAILRIVDMIGNDAAIKHVGGSLQRLVEKTECDYVDIMHYGIDTEQLRIGGFVDRDHSPSLILPNYFEPFVSKNIDIDLAFRVSGEAADCPIRLMRADSDQDRPNVGPLSARNSSHET